MREPLFIKKNKARWENYDDTAALNSDEKSDRFLHILDDLSYAQTFYPRSKTHRYLNERAVGYYNAIYKNRKFSFSSIFNFWKYELPLIVRNRHRYLLIAFLIFALFTIIGWVSVDSNPQFLNTFLGEGYADMTRENISNGNPFGVYSDDNKRLDMFTKIAFNNLKVSLLVFVGGLFFTLGTVYLTMTNGLMLGGFQKMFFDFPEMGWKSILVIWIHGTLEISAIIIAAGAGLALGNSFLFPGNLTRFESFKKGALDGIKIMMGIMPIIVLAAILESYVTRLGSNNFDNIIYNQTELPVWGSVAILAISAIFIIWYFILYPIYIEKKLLKEQAAKQQTLVFYDKEQ
jgi:uncharacterized membrane protein SpoIIM required for sporulation